MKRVDKRLARLAAAWKQTFTEAKQAVKEAVKQAKYEYQSQRGDRGTICQSPGIPARDDDPVCGRSQSWLHVLEVNRRRLVCSGRLAIASRFHRKLSGDWRVFFVAGVTYGMSRCSGQSRGYRITWRRLPEAAVIGKVMAP